MLNNVPEILTPTEVRITGVVYRDSVALVVEPAFCHTSEAPFVYLKIDDQLTLRHPTYDWL